MNFLTIKSVKVEQMFAIDATEKGYRVDGCYNHTPGYEVTYEDGYKSWCPCDVFIKNSIIKRGEYILPERPANLPDFVNRMYDEHQELYHKLYKLGLFLYTDKFKQLTPDRQHYLELQYNFMEGYLSVLTQRIDIELYNNCEENH